MIRLGKIEMQGVYMKHYRELRFRSHYEKGSSRNKNNQIKTHFKGDIQRIQELVRCRGEGWESVGKGILF